MTRVVRSPLTRKELRATGQRQTLYVVSHRTYGKRPIDLDNLWLAKRTILDGDCWIWIGAKNAHGYGKLKYRGQNWAAHRLVYEWMVGRIPEGLTLDHLCRRRPCVNPAHLEPVTMAINSLRGEGIAARRHRQTSCIHGHPFDDENTYWHRDGRACRACRRIREREKRR